MTRANASSCTKRAARTTASTGKRASSTAHQRVHEAKPSETTAADNEQKQRPHQEVESLFDSIRIQGATDNHGRIDVGTSSSHVMGQEICERGKYHDG
jgi:hypothetical protein